MTRKEATELLPLIEAYSKGKTIEWYSSNTNRWIDQGEDCDFAFSPKTYRIKLSPTHRPFVNVEECWNEMLKHQPFGWVKGKCGIYTNVTIVNPDEASVSTGISDFHSFGDMLKDYTFADGTPFGIKEE